MGGNSTLTPAERRRRQGLITLTVVQVFFGLFSVFAKLATEPEHGFEPRAVAFWRISVGALVLGSVALFRFRRELLPRRSELLLLFGLGSFGIVINQVLALEGVSRTSATMASMLMVLIPVFTYALALMIKQETLQLRRVAGILLALCGALGLVLLRADDLGMVGASAPRLGGLLILLNCLSYSCFMILARGILQRRPVLWVIAWTFLMALLWLPFLQLGVPLYPSAPSREALIGLGLLVSLCTVLSYVLNTYALARVSASTAASFVFLQPLVGVFFAWLLLGEEPGFKDVWPVILLFAGLWLVIGGRRLARR